MRSRSSCSSRLVDSRTLYALQGLVGGVAARGGQLPQSAPCTKADCGVRHPEIKKPRSAGLFITTSSEQLETAKLIRKQFHRG
jgi:hypothetical protein